MFLIAQEHTENTEWLLRNFLLAPWICLKGISFLFSRRSNKVEKQPLQMLKYTIKHLCRSLFFRFSCVEEKLC